MVIVNFGVVMGIPDSGSIWSEFYHFMQGKAAATFVVLAGLGIGLAGFGWRDLVPRAVFLFIIGMINLLIFPADIIHYYAVYFICVIPFLALSTRAIGGAIIALTLIAALFVLVGNYDAGWNWNTLEYTDFWTPIGFLRNLILNGWHPVLPWLGFVLYGVILSRLDLNAWRRRLAGGGIVAVALISGVSFALITGGNADDAVLFGTGSIPPMPLYVAIGCASASAVIGLCLILYAHWPKIMHPLAQAGSVALTLYFAHIILGMGAMEMAGLIDSGTPRQAAAWSIVFCAIALLASLSWLKFFKRGPLEAIMRRVVRPIGR